MTAHPDIREHLRAARETDDPNRLLSAIPYARFLGLTMARRDDRLVATMAFADHLIGNSRLPALHGGTLGALLESTAIVSVLFAMDDATALPKTVNLTVEYLRSGRAQDTFAAATITKHGRRVVNVQARAWQDDESRPIAAAHAHFLLSSS